MKLYKARNGHQDKEGKNLYVFVLAEDDEQAEAMAKEAFSRHKTVDTGNKEFIRMHAIIEEISEPATSAVWAL